ncbi:hypothetical protein GQ53DRAFT_518189 [Thozetella sp. PMI_491]|nr:hypothetical protein GQ53DRAFT_518189 [Thozetella sp. PMI_491]
MAPRHPDDDLLQDDDELESRNPHASATRWRHEESSSFARHAARQHRAAPVARDADVRGDTNDLASFLNASRISPEKAANNGDGPNTPRFKPIMAGAMEARDATNGDSAPDVATDPPAVLDGKEIAVGPLLNYRRMENDTWHGSVLVVVKGGGKEQAFVPTLELHRVGHVEGHQAGETNGVASEAGASSAQGICLYSDRRNTFWRFNLAVPLESTEVQWEYSLPGLRFASETKPQRNAFFVPAVTESMRIMFHSCNGFSVGTDEEAWSGPALWNDVIRRHREAPFHVMIGGGDQIYNDGIRVHGPLNKWTAIGNPKKRRDFPFPESLRAECDEYYLKNYIRWYGTEPFASANGQIPQLNIWDDHDIIDGFGSYVNDFMKCDVFRGIGGTAHKYYMLFQHHLPPPPSTYTSDAVSKAGPDHGQGIDPNQLTDVFVHDRMTESNYIVGSKPGPYVAEHSHNMFARLGARIAFVGIDARTERTRHQVNYPETYDQIFDRLKQELGSAASAGKPYRHLILLLGIPIAYPRLTWLENIFSSPLMGPIKFMNKRFGLAGGFINHFDGSVDLLDDLDDHYTAKTHKKERNHFVERLQGIAGEFSVRITILGGDVHLAALGRFYSKTSLNIPTENDYRYMVNVVSSAIVNKPPPQAIANLLARRNKIHHLNHETDETLLKLFNKDPGESNKTAGHNKVTMPSRNFAIITENSPNNPPSVTESVPPLPTLSQTHLAPPPPLNPDAINGGPPGSSGGHSIRSRTSKVSKISKVSGKDGHSALSAGEQDCGTTHKAASATEHGKGNDGSLDVQIRVEIDQHDRQGRTEAYGLTVPLLEYHGPKPPSVAPPATARSLASTAAT